MKPTDTINVGWVDYYNLLPLKLELQRLWRKSISFTFAPPRQINKKLRERQVDVAMGSSICLAAYKGIDMALPLGVACDGAVQSVYIGFVKSNTRVIDHIKARNYELAARCRTKIAADRHDFRGLARLIFAQTEALAFPYPPQIKLSPHSFASNSLTQIFYYLWFGADCYSRFASRSVHWAATDQADAYVVIGDEALTAAEKFAHVIDLGAVWKEITSLPFVYAVAMSASPLSRIWQQRIRNAADVANSKKLHDPQSYLQHVAETDRHSLDLCGYWRNIYYHLKEREFCGLYLFLNLYLLLPNTLDNTTMLLSDSMSTRMLHWESLANKAKENESPNLL
ncbi:MAG: hypothetical protein OYH77_08860 [Pseudomonadota bacterium]|nr:hypothetical protein [Pseudomonadota bacterium]